MTVNEIVTQAVVSGFNAGAAEANAERDRCKGLLRRLVDAIERGDAVDTEDLVAVAKATLEASS